MFDLIDRDDVVRGRALTRHRTLVTASGDALHRYNAIWQEAGTPAPEQPHLAAAIEQAWADHQWQSDQTLFGRLGTFLDAEPEDAAVRMVYWPFVALYLRWESRFPDQWRAPESNLWSPWTRKERLLRQLGKSGLPENGAADTVDLIVTALRRPYRCKDWAYALLVPHVANTEFHDRVAVLTDAADPLVRLRARFVLDVAVDPERAVTRRTWSRWLERYDAQPG